jgi:CheY-like chemotaxis protein
MPGMDGFEVIRRMRANAATAGIPVMVVTASYLDERAREFLKQNTQSLFQKGSFWIEDLLREVERVLAERRAK